LSGQKPLFVSWPLRFPILLKPLAENMLVHCQVLLTAIFVCFGSIASPDEGAAVRTCETMEQLRNTTGKAGDARVLLGFERPGDGGGGLFYWTANSEKQANGGTVVDCKNAGSWTRFYTGTVHVSWFGVFPTPVGKRPSVERVKETTTRLDHAFKAAAGDTLRFGKGHYFLSDTLIVPGSTRLEGAGPEDVWSNLEGGTTLWTFGPGKARIWQDTGVKEDDLLRPLLVCGGPNVRFENLGLRTKADDEIGTTRWDVGILLPATKRCSLDHVSIKGYWNVAACLLDATWSERNQRMIALHGGRITPGSMNECTIFRCFLSGRWGVMIRGVDVAVRDPRKFRDYDKTGIKERIDDWVWSYGGTSDIEIISSRIEGKLPKKLQQTDGGAFYSDAPMVNGAAAGQGHRIIGCNLRTNTRYMVKLGASNRDSFIGCYFEGGWAQKQASGDFLEAESFMTNNAERTGQTRFIDCRFTTCDTKSQWDDQKTETWP
jgi:hypothetical protein